MVSPFLCLTVNSLKGSPAIGLIFCPPWTYGRDDGDDNGWQKMMSNICVGRWRPYCRYNAHSMRRLERPCRRKIRPILSLSLAIPVFLWGAASADPLDPSAKAPPATQDRPDFPAAGPL